MKPEKPIHLREILIARRNRLLETCLARLKGSQAEEQISVTLRLFFEAMQGAFHDASGDLADEAAAGNAIARCLDQAVTLALIAHGYDAVGSFSQSKPADIAILGTSPAMVAVRAGVMQLARRSRTPVLIVGELGTGKRHCARALHEATFPEGELFELNGAAQLAALDERLADLRCRTSSRAVGGMTIYVHELSEALPGVQLAASRLVREQSLQLRVIASTRRPLTQAARSELVRPDLAFAFPVQVELPPLRDRNEDIAGLAAHFCELTARRTGVAPTSFDASALARLSRHEWPGNLSELLNVVRHLSLSVGPGVVSERDLPPLSEPTVEAGFQLPRKGLDLGRLERDLLVQALALSKNNQSHAARLLGLTRDQIRYRLIKFGMQAELARD